MASSLGLFRLAAKIAQNQVPAPSVVPEDDVEGFAEDLESAYEQDADPDFDEDFDVNTEAKEDPDFGATSGGTEFSARVELDLNATFVGSVSKKVLNQKIKEHLRNAITQGMSTMAAELRLSQVETKVIPIKIELSAIDESEVDLFDDSIYNGDDDGQPISEDEVNPDVEAELDGVAPGPSPENEDVY